jgi:hypothetical protein
MMNARLASERKMMKHAEEQYQANGKHCTGEIMKGYLEILERCGDKRAFESLLEKITADAEAVE